MKLFNLIPASESDFEKWIEETLPVTNEQMTEIRENRLVRFAPFVLMQRKERVRNIWIRLSALLLPFVFIVLIVGLPINYIITGNRGYSKRMFWFLKWMSACGFNAF